MQDTDVSLHQKWLKNLGGYKKGYDRKILTQMRTGALYVTQFISLSYSGVIQ